jgi:hypothetical protein
MFIQRTDYVDGGPDNCKASAATDERGQTHRPQIELNSASPQTKLGIFQRRGCELQHWEFILDVNLSDFTEFLQTILESHKIQCAH